MHDFGNFFSSWYNLIFRLPKFSHTLTISHCGSAILFLCFQISGLQSENFVEKRCPTIIPSAVIRCPLLGRSKIPPMKICRFGFGNSSHFLDSHSRFGFGVCKYLDSDSRFEIRIFLENSRFGFEIRIRYIQIFRFGIEIRPNLANLRISRSANLKIRKALAISYKNHI